MITLKELVMEQLVTKDEDITLIKRWFLENNREQDGLTLIPNLAKSQADKIQRKYDYALSWTPNLQDLRKTIKDKTTADMLNQLQLYATLDYPMQDDNKFLIWARENIHNKMEIPKVFFMPTVVYLLKYGVEFVMSDADKKYIENCFRR